MTLWLYCSVRFGIGQQPTVPTEDMEVEVEGEEDGEGRGPFTIDLTHPGYRQDHLWHGLCMCAMNYVPTCIYFQAGRAGICAVHSGVGGLGLHLLTIKERSQDEEDYMKILQHY